MHVRVYVCVCELEVSAWLELISFLLARPVEKVTFHLPARPIRKITCHLPARPVGKIISHLPARPVGRVRASVWAI